MILTAVTSLLAQNEGGGIAGAIVPMFIMLVVLAIIIASNWIIFTKAGKPGWASIIPIYNVIVLLEIIGRPIWWIILMFIPCVSIIVSIVICIDLAKSFGKDVGFGLGLAILGFIFFPVLAFGSSRYQGPAAAQG